MHKGFGGLVFSHKEQEREIREFVFSHKEQEIQERQEK